MEWDISCPIVFQPMAIEKDYKYTVGIFIKTSYSILKVLTIRILKVLSIVKYLSVLKVY